MDRIRCILLSRGEFTKLDTGGAERIRGQIVENTLDCGLSHAAAVEGVLGFAGGAHDCLTSRLVDG